MLSINRLATLESAATLLVISGLTFCMGIPAAKSQSLIGSRPKSELSLDQKQQGAAGPNVPTDPPPTSDEAKTNKSVPTTDVGERVRALEDRLEEMQRTIAV